MHDDSIAGIAPGERQPTGDLGAAYPHQGMSASSGRNAPCPCGSGRRFKACCGALSGAANATAGPSRAASLPSLVDEADRRGDFAAVLDHVWAAIEHDPNSGFLANRAGRALCAVGRLAEGEHWLRKAIELAPDDLDYVSDVGIALLAQRRPLEAIGVFETCVRRSIGSIAARSNLAVALVETGRTEEAIELMESIVDLDPSSVSVQANLADALVRVGRIDEAIDRYRRVLAQAPDDRAAWDAMLLAMNYECSHSPLEIAQDHRAYGSIFSGPGDASRRRHPNDRDPRRVLRIGYVSADLGRHPVASFVEPLLANHDPASVEVHILSNRTQDDEVTARLRALAPRWHSIARLADSQAAQLVEDLGIDVLVDLSGHTAGNRLALFALKPAPVQVSWLGYPNTTGLGAIDYRLTDAVADPPGVTESLHTEELVRLDFGFLAYAPPPEAPAPGEPPCQRDGVVRFGSLNNITKVGPGLISLWARILADVANSRLLLKARDPEAAGRRLRRSFRDHGIDGGRIEILGWVPRQIEHLEAYREIDVGLDTFPYVGTTTTCEALWMGVPVVTLAGSTHAARVGASLLSTLGLHAWIAESPEAYRSTAVALARDPKRLVALRAGLRERLQHSPLCDGAGFARRLESAYRRMWLRWLAGEAPTATRHAPAR